MMQFSTLLGFIGLASTVFGIPAPQNSGVCINRGISASRAQQVRNAFTNAKITPQVIPFFTPKVEVSVDYNGKQVNLGNKFSTLETLMEPSISFTAETDRDPFSTKYVILFIDPDAPMPTQSGQPAILSNFLHLAVYDAAPSCAAGGAKLGGGKTLAMYKPLTPLSGASHRYIQLVYRQPPGYTPPPELSYLAGGFFDVNAFVAEGRLTHVGGNYFLQGLQDLGAIGK